MSQKAWLTQNSIPSTRSDLVLNLPDSWEWRAQFLGAFLLLTLENNWELFGTLTPEEMADEWRDLFLAFLEQGGDIVFDDITADTLKLTSTAEASLSSTTHALQVGPDSGLNVIFDQDEVQARNNGAAASLFLNPHGGSAQCPTIRATAGNAVALATSAQSFETGVRTALNLAYSGSAIQARNNGAASPLALNPLGGTVKIDQPSTTGALPPLHLKQADLSEELIRFESTVAAGNPINTTGLGAYYGRVRVYVEGVGFKWLALYD